MGATPVPAHAPAPFVFRALGPMASLCHTRAPCLVMGLRLTGFPAWWLPHVLAVPDAAVGLRLRIVLDWTLALFFRPDITEVGLQVERQLTEQMLRSSFSKNRAPTV